MLTCRIINELTNLTRYGEGQIHLAFADMSFQPAIDIVHDPELLLIVLPFDERIMNE